MRIFDVVLLLNSCYIVKISRIRKNGIVNNLMFAKHKHCEYIEFTLLRITASILLENELLLII